MVSRRKYLRYAVGGIAGGLAGCLGSVGGSKSPKVKKYSLTTDFLFGGKYAGIFIAQKEGYYLDNGISLDVRAGHGSASTAKEVGAGSTDFGIADIAQFGLIQSKGTDVSAVMTHYATYPIFLIFRKSLGISKPKDLEGHSLVNHPALAQWNAIPAFCKRNNVDYNKIDVIQVSPANLISYWVDGKADLGAFYAGSDGTVAEVTADKNGIDYDTMFLSNYGFNIYSNVFGTRQSIIKENPEHVAGFVKATQQGFEYAKQHPGEAVDYTLSVHPDLDKSMTRKQLDQLLQNQFSSPETKNHAFGYMDKSKMGDTVSFINDYYPVDKKIAAKDLYTDKYVTS